MQEVNLTLAQAERYQTIKAALQGALNNEQAAKALRISVRQVQRLKQRVKCKGAAGVIHLNTGRKPANAIAPSIKEQVIRLASDEYQNYNFSHLADTLAEEHKIKLSDETLRLWMRPLGMGKAQRRLKKHRRRRPRREQEGELLFLDGSPHPWFGDDGPKVCLLLSSDDATGKPLWGKFQPNEDRNGCFEVCAQVFRRYGLPTAFYLDRASQFTTTRHGGTHVRQGPEVEHTHFERAMAQLAIGIIFAHSPQARGRGERLNGSFQQRLVAELVRKGITDCKAATKYLNGVFIPKYQKRFGRLPANPNSAWRPLLPEVDLQQILSAQHERMVANDNTVSFQGQDYQLTPPPGRCHLLHARIQVQERFDGSIHFVHPKLGELKTQKIEFDRRRKRVA